MDHTENKELKTSATQLQAAKRYLSKFVDLKIRITANERDEIHRHAEAMGESTSAFIKRAISETMDRDEQK